MLPTVAVVLGGDCTPSLYPIDTPDWPDGLPASGGYVLLLQSRSDAAGSLLLRYVEQDAWVQREEALGGSDVVYRYVEGASHLEPRRLADWAGSVANSPRREPVSPPLGTEQMAIDDHTLKLGAHSPTVIPTKGKTPLAAHPSPDWRLYAVLSAAGEPRRSLGIWPLLGGAPYVSGPRFHEFLRTPDGARVGDATRLLGIGPDDCIDVQWSPDGRYVVYYDCGFERFWIVSASAAHKEAGR